MKRRLGKLARCLLPVMLIVSLTTAILPATPVLAAGWLGTWAYRVKLTTDNTDIDGALTNFPLMLEISTTAGRNNDDISFVFDRLTADANRKKIAVTTTDGTTQCYVEIEQWDDASEKAWLWVKAPSIASGADQDFYLYYDSSKADNNAYVGDTNSVVAENVWDANYKAVYHMRDGVDNAHIYDSTSGDHDGNKFGANTPQVVAGKVGECQDFDGTGDAIALPDHADFDFVTALTVEVWVRFDTIPQSATTLPIDKEPVWRAVMSGGLDADQASMGIFSAGWQFAVGDTILSSATWFQHTATYDKSYMKVYHDGALDMTPVALGVDISTNDAVVGIGDYQLGGGYEMAGLMDEMRFSNVCRNAAWIAAAYETQRDHLLDWGSEEELSITPSVTTNAVDDIEETTATLNANVTAINDTNITERGFVWHLSSLGDPGDTDPDDSDYTWNWTQVATYGTGVFDYAKSGLTEGELYFVRGCARNDLPAWGYGDEVEFLTKPDEPVIFDAVGGGATEIDLTWVKGDGAQKTYIRGKEDAYPANRADGILVYNDVGVSYTHAGLDNLDVWYYRAWSYATEGGVLEQFSDLYLEDWAVVTDWNAPSVTSDVCSGFGANWAILNATLDDIGDNSVTQVGFNYGLTSAYGSEVTKSGSWSDGDEFWMIVTGLDPGANYHWEGKAFNGAWGTGLDMVFSTEGSDTLYEYQNTGGTIEGEDIYAGRWSAMQFTVGTTAHSLTKARIYVKRTGTPGDAILSLKHADDADKPTGIDLDVKTLDGDLFADTLNWVEYEFPLEVTMEAGESYALVLRCPDGDVASYLEWRLAAGSVLANAVGSDSTDSGISWTNVGAGGDYLFEIWGEPVFEVLSANVFTGYLEPGDWLVVATYRNYFKPYYPSESCPANFYMRLIDDTTMVAQSGCPAWRYRPGSLYFSKALADTMEWGATDYKFRLYEDGGSNAYTDYVIAAADWRGEVDPFLDDWVIEQANVIGDDTGIELVTEVEDRGEVLNEVGSAMFRLGIPDLANVRPDIFAFGTWRPDIETDEFTDALQEATDWETRVGTTVAGILTTAGTMAQINGKDVGALICVIVMLGIMVVVNMKGGSFRKGALLGSPMLVAGAWFGFIDFIILAVVVAILGVATLAYKLWLRG